MNEYVREVMFPLLEKAWQANPHMRLGQLISNAANAGVQDIYYIEDGALADGLRRAENGDFF